MQESWWAEWLYEKVANLWLEASPYMGIGYKNGVAEGGHKTTATNEIIHWK